MEVRPAMDYVFRVTVEEFRLIGLALAGKIKNNSKEERDARALNEKMLTNRVSYLKDTYQQAQGALDVCVQEKQERRTNHE